MRALREVGARPLLVCSGSAAGTARPLWRRAVLRDGRVRAVSAYGASNSRRRMPHWRFPKHRDTGTDCSDFQPDRSGHAAPSGAWRFCSADPLPASCGSLQTGNIQVYRDFIDVDTSRALYRLAEHPLPGAL